MAIRRIIAAIDVVINGQRQIDNLAQGYANLDRMVTSSIRNFQAFNISTNQAVNFAARLSQSLGLSANAFVRVGNASITASRGVNALVGGARNLGANFGSMVGAIDRGRTAFEAHNRATRGLRDNIVSLTRSMLMFSVLLPVVRLPQTAIESFGNFIQVSNEFMNSMRAANALLGLSEENFGNFTSRVMEMRAQTGLLNKDMGVLVEAASSVNAIVRDEAAFKAMGEQAYNADVAFKLAQGSAQLARATFTDAAESQKVLIQVMSTYQMGVNQMLDVQNNLFALTDVGNVRFNELEGTLPRVSAAMAPYIQAATTAAEKQDIMNQSMATFAALTHSMTPEMAATGFANIYKDIGQMSAEQQNLIRNWESFRKRQGMGTNMSLDPAILQANGPLAAVEQLRRLLDIQGPMVQQYVANQRLLGNTAPEEGLRIAGQEYIGKLYFGDQRGSRAFVSQTAEQLQQSYDAYMQSRTGALARGQAQADLNPASVLKNARASFENLQAQFGKAVEGPQIGVANWFTSMVDTTLKSANFQSGDIFQRIQIVAGNFMDAFANWFNIMGGRGQTTNIGYRLGTFISESVRAFFTGGKDNVLIEAAGAFATGFANAVQEQLPALLGDVLRSSITQAVAEAIALRYITQGRMPNNVSRLTAVGGTAVLQGLGGVQGLGPLPGALAAVAGATLVGAAATSGLRRSWRAQFETPIETGRTLIGPGGQPVPETLTSAGGAFNWARGMIFGRAASPAGPPTMPTTGGLVRPRLNALMRGGGRIGGSLLMNALFEAPALIGTLMDPNAAEREKWQAGGSALGSIGGGALGALAGGGLLSLVTGSIGMMAGGGIGNYAGGALFDMLHPNRGTGQGGLADAGAPERAAAAEVFATGIDMSSLPRYLGEMLNLMVHGTGMGGARPGPVGAEPFGGGTGRGSLTSMTIDQQSMSKELGNEEALAICGPMAAAYFARANGRNPNLKEAVELAKTNFGGTFTGPGAAGMSITGVANLANNLAGGNVAEPFFGAPNWSRIQGDVAGGKPAIVNVGPAGKFGGHFFQVAGYDPSTGQYDMGASGDVIGHQRFWTQAQLQALGGGVVGGVYYNGNPVAGGAPTGLGPLQTAAYNAAVAAGIDPNIYMRQIQQESGFNPNARSGAGAMGIAQFMQGTFGAGVNWDPFDPNVALTKGAQYMAQLSGKYGGMRNALWAYNAGEGNFQQGVMPDETKRYLSTILGGTGKGGVTEADISTITGRGDALGGGGAGGAPVQINIQNLMNVEKMDGSTDVRALLGQMADILNQLSSGGSVVGQSGMVAPS